MRILGIDLSLTSPALCFFEGDEYNINGCTFYYLTKQKKLEGTFDSHGVRVRGDLFIDHEGNDILRYHAISMWVNEWIPVHSPEHIFLENYSYSSTGQVFNIAENTGILKYNLWKQSEKYTVIPPTVIKKMATGKGNANKALMEQSFLETTGFNIRELLQLSQSVSNPISDLIDAYYVGMAGIHYGTV